jgi:hypothetical protein
MNSTEYGQLTLAGTKYLANFEELNPEIRGKIRAFLRTIIVKNDLATCTHFHVPWGMILEEGGYMFGKPIMVSHEKPLLEMLRIILKESSVRRRYCIFNNGVDDPWTIAFVY